MRADLLLLKTGKSVKRKRAVRRRWKLAKNIAQATTVFALLGTSAIFAIRELNRNRPHSSNSTALELYETAVYQLNRSTLDGHLQAFTNLTEAVKRDPQFVDAYYKMFEAYFGPWGNELPPHKNMMANFIWVADKLRAWPDSAQYHTVNSYIKFNDWRFDEAIDEIKLAIKLDPKFLRAHGIYAGITLVARGDAKTALSEYEAAQRLDGSDATIKTHLGDPYYVARDFPKAIEQYQKALQLEDRLVIPHFSLGRAHEANKEYDKALEEYEAQEKLLNRDEAEIEARYKRCRSALAKEGPRGMWRAMLDEWRQSPSPNPYAMAVPYARLGDTNEVFPLLDQAYREHNTGLFELLMDVVDDWSGGGKIAGFCRGHTSMGNAHASRAVFRVLAEHKRAHTEFPIW